ncbi:unnamed protein product [Miscanthus lutarioriparius]|uniref:aspartate--tRNA ligase n=1 Tax=Miscanthus lutarioriparius TaxID=422564 RepID=A0A811NZ05_9POAL|nr:unnamed protein product [Miscanthus lutarioriparius]
MVQFTAAFSIESCVHVEGVVSLPEVPIATTTQQVEIQVSKIYCINRATSMLPFSIEDAARSEAEQAVHVGQDTCLNARALHLRLLFNQAGFRIKTQVKNKFREFLSSKDFVEIETPKLMAGSSEGGAAVFKLLYHGQPACLAQSPQLHKQMAICGGFERVFEVGPVFRAETSRTPRHLCEFTGLDAEMEIMEHYFEVCDVIAGLFVSIFRHLNENCKEELGVINKQRPFEPLKDAVTELEPMGDLTTEAEKVLGRLVKEKYGTDFYILHRYPLAVRPFYIMPCPDKTRLTAILSMSSFEPWRTSTWWFRGGVGEGDGALLRPQQHQGDVHVPP